MVIRYDHRKLVQRHKRLNQQNSLLDENDMLLNESNTNDNDPENATVTQDTKVDRIKGKIRYKKDTSEKVTVTNTKAAEDRNGSVKNKQKAREVYSNADSSEEEYDSMVKIVDKNISNIMTDIEEKQKKRESNRIKSEFEEIKERLSGLLEDYTETKDETLARENMKLQSLYNPRALHQQKSECTAMKMGIENMLNVYAVICEDRQVALKDVTTTFAVDDFKDYFKESAYDFNDNSFTEINLLFERIDSKRSKWYNSFYKLLEFASKHNGDNLKLQGNDKDKGKSVQKKAISQFKKLAEEKSERKEKAETWKNAADEIVDLLKQVRKEGVTNVEKVEEQFEKLLVAFKAQNEQLMEHEEKMDILKSAFQNQENTKENLKEENVLLQEEIEFWRNNQKPLQIKCIKLENTVNDLIDEIRKHEEEKTVFQQEEIKNNEMRTELESKTFALEQKLKQYEGELSEEKKRTILLSNNLSAVSSTTMTNSQKDNNEKMSKLKECSSCHNLRVEYSSLRRKLENMQELHHRTCKRLEEMNDKLTNASQYSGNEIQRSDPMTQGNHDKDIQRNSLNVLQRPVEKIQEDPLTSLHSKQDIKVSAVVNISDKSTENTSESSQSETISTKPNYKEFKDAAVQVDTQTTAFENEIASLTQKDSELTEDNNNKPLTSDIQDVARLSKKVFNFVNLICDLTKKDAVIEKEDLQRSEIKEQPEHSGRSKEEEKNIVLSPELFQKQINSSREKISWKPDQSVASEPAHQTDSNYKLNVNQNDNMYSIEETNENISDAFQASNSNEMGEANTEQTKIQNSFENNNEVKDRISSQSYLQERQAATSQNINEETLTTTNKQSGALTSFENSGKSQHVNSKIKSNEEVSKGVTYDDSLDDSVYINERIKQIPAQKLKVLKKNSYNEGNAKHVTQLSSHDNIPRTTQENNEQNNRNNFMHHKKQDSATNSNSERVPIVASVPDQDRLQRNWAESGFFDKSESSLFQNQHISWKKTGNKTIQVLRFLKSMSTLKCSHLEEKVRNFNSQDLSNDDKLSLELQAFADHAIDLLEVLSFIGKRVNGKTLNDQQIIPEAEITRRKLSSWYPNVALPNQNVDLNDFDYKMSSVENRDPDHIKKRNDRNEIKSERNLSTNFDRSIHQDPRPPVTFPVSTSRAVDKKRMKVLEKHKTLVDRLTASGVPIKQVYTILGLNNRNEPEDFESLGLMPHPVRSSTKNQHRGRRVSVVGHTLTNKSIVNNMFPQVHFSETVQPSNFFQINTSTKPHFSNQSRYHTRSRMQSGIELGINTRRQQQSVSLFGGHKRRTVFPPIQMKKTNNPQTMDNLIKTSPLTNAFKQNHY